VYLEIVTPDKKIFAGEVSLIRLPGSNGSFEILENHAALISTLEEGPLRIIDKEGKEHTISIKNGVVECLDNNIVVLVESKK
jgi:F-type H+-transporting ATPase subunit epsilon